MTALERRHCLRLALWRRLGGRRGPHWRAWYAPPAAPSVLPPLLRPEPPVFCGSYFQEAWTSALCRTPPTTTTTRTPCRAHDSHVVAKVSPQRRGWRAELGTFQAELGGCYPVLKLQGLMPLLRLIFSGPESEKNW